MCTRRHLAVSVALALVSVSGAVGAGSPGAPAGAAVIAGHAAHGRRWVRCVIDLPSAPVRAYADGPAGDGAQPGAAPARTRPGPAGDVSVTIPPTVFIRVGRKRIVVTTNTRVPPVSADGFWVLARGRATPAGTSLQAEVLAACTPPLPR